VIKQKKPAQDVSFEEKMKMVLDTDKLLRDEENKIKSTRSIYTDVIRRQTLATSEGTLIYEERPYTNFYLIPTARKGTDTNQGMGRAGHVGGFELFDMVDIKKRAEETVIKTIKGLEAEKIKPGKYPVVFDGSINFLFAHEAAGHSAEADFLRSAGVLRGKLNKKLSPDFVNLVDDGSLEYIPGYKSRTFGFMKYDDEGVPVERTEIIRNGVLETYLTDRTNATFFNLKPTGNCRAEYFSSQPIVRMRNTFLEASKGKDMSEEELLELVRNGALLKRGGGGQVNPVRGTFNFGVSEVYEIKNSITVNNVRMYDGNVNLELPQSDNTERTYIISNIDVKPNVIKVYPILNGGKVCAASDTATTLDNCLFLNSGTITIPKPFLSNTLFISSITLSKSSMCSIT